MTAFTSKNPDSSFPTIVLDGGERVILGFQETEIKDYVKGK